MAKFFKKKNEELKDIGFPDLYKKTLRYMSTSLDFDK